MIDLQDELLEKLLKVTQGMEQGSVSLSVAGWRKPQFCAPEAQFK